MSKYKFLIALQIEKSRTVSKIYTKKGDLGRSSLMYTRDIPKNNSVFEALGNIDELNSFLGLMLAKVNVKSPLLLELSHVLFDLGGIIAVEKITEDDTMYIESVILSIEEEIDNFMSQLEPLKNFILPGGSEAVALIHVCRSCARRAERSVWAFSDTYSIIGKLLNRLSDYFFVLSRYQAKSEGVKEVIWRKPGER
jgi:cob(I)alamin adenosyltransferase